MSNQSITITITIDGGTVFSRQSRDLVGFEFELQ